MLLRTKLHGKTYEFPDIRLLMGRPTRRNPATSWPESLQRPPPNASLPALSWQKCRSWVLYDPAVPYDQDEVTRVIHDAVDQPFTADQGLDGGEFREWLLADTTTPT